MVDTKIFDDFPEVECNNCEPYWNNQCDGTPVGSERPCKAFKATRKVDIPDELDALRTHLTCLSVAFMLLGVAFVCHMIAHIVWGG